MTRTETTESHVVFTCRKSCIDRNLEKAGLFSHKVVVLGEKDSASEDRLMRTISQVLNVALSMGTTVSSDSDLIHETSNESKRRYAPMTNIAGERLNCKPLTLCALFRATRLALHCLDPAIRAESRCSNVHYSSPRMPKA